MGDLKEQVVDSICMKMNLDKVDDERLRDVLYIELNNFTLSKTNRSDIVLYEETYNNRIMKQFFIAKTVQGCTAKTIQYYKLILEMFLEFMHWRRLDEISTNDIRYYFAIKKERDHNSDSNIDNIRRVLSAFYNWCCEEELISKNPVLKIKKIRKEKLVKKPFKDVEVEKLRLQAKDDLRMTALIEVLLSTGCRISEVCGMNISDVEGDEIVVYGKGKKERIVYLNAKARISLERYLESRTDKNDAMFVMKRSPYGRISTGGIESAIRQLGNDCGITDVHPHRFRRTAATMALNRGMPIEQVQLMLGHESINTTTLYAISAQEAVKANHKKYVV